MGEIRHAIDSFEVRESLIPANILYPNEGPRYTVVPIVKTPNINTGDKIKIVVYLIGYGIPIRNKLSIAHSQPQVLDVDNPGEIRTTISGVNYQNEQSQWLVGGKAAIENE